MYSDWSDDVSEELEKFAQETKKKRGDGKGIPPWILRNRNYRLTSQPVLVHLYPGSYAGNRKTYVYYSAWRTKKDNRKEQIICSCGGGKLETPCALHYYQQKDEDSDLIAKPRVVANAMICEDFHWMERSNPTTKATWKEPVLCNGIDRIGRSLCQYCDAGTEKTFGLRSFLAFGQGFWKNLMEIQRQNISTVCHNCGGILEPLRFACSGCKAVFLDTQKPGITGLRDLITHFSADKVNCINCGLHAKANMIVGCYQKGPGGKMIGGCDKPEPCTIFDMPLRLATAGTEKNSSLVCKSTTEEFRVTPMDPRMTNLATPFPFEEMFAMSVDEQLKMLGRPNPFLEEGAAPSGKDEALPY